MLQIEDTHYIGEGEIRTCYEHPENKHLCIKIAKPGVSIDYANKEILYFNKLSKRKNKGEEIVFYSDYRGEVETTKGLGQIFDLVRDETTGDISKTLEYYIHNIGLVDAEKLWKGILELKTYMTKFRVYTRDLRARNLCCKINANSSISIVIIDGIGHRDFFPLADYFSFFAKKKIERTFTKWHFTSMEDQVIFLKK